MYEVTRIGTPTGVSWSTRPTLTDVAAISIDPRSRTLYVSNDGANLVAEFGRDGTLIRSFSVRPAGSVNGDSRRVR